ncbi:MAG TPA: type VI secretion system Vgr family protein [Paraburkholderia sp.]|uniref:type VI secretion system Vgr family protein n=1 Tax=Paraburkholderia sp. TaxID=1926495 RepID=UPI002B47A9AB|nr:type VI secretion system Vgr family protein [Paraburkholderia sp.]HKR47514.1 type VI secretion system Vgr family protein [Paraburkholderia sp.]
MAEADVIDQIRSGVLQNSRLLKLDTPLGSDMLLVQRVVGKSRVGRDYDFTLDVASLSDSIELKSLIAQPVTLWLQQTDKSYRPMNGYVHTARRLGSDGGFTSYQLVLSSWMHFLRFRKDARIFQEKAADAIIEAIFAQHPQAAGAYRFEIAKPAPVRSFCMQYEDDYHFVHRLMESEGWFCAVEQTSDGKSHTLVITDDVYSLKPLSPQQVEFYRSSVASETDALVQWVGTRELQSTSYTFSTVDYKAPQTPKTQSIPTKSDQGGLPDQAEVYEYGGAYTYADGSRGEDISRFRMEEWESRAKRFLGTGSVRGMDAGRWFEFTNYPEYANESASSCQFTVIEARWYIENNLAVGGNVQPYPFSLQSELERVRCAHQGTNSGAANPYAVALADAITGASSNSAPSAGFFLVEIEAQRRTVPFRSPFDHTKPVLSTQTATVVGPSGEEVYTDSLNRVKVLMNWDRSSNREDASCWMRVMSTHAGSNFGGVYVPRIGQEVVVTFLDGDCDRPLISGAVFNGNQTPQWHTQGTMSGYKSKEYKGQGFNQLVFDDTTGQNRSQLFSSSANSYLHLGHLVAQQDNTREAFLGTGFDLKTEAYGAVRATKGLYLSTFTRGGTASEPLDVKEANTHLTDSAAIMEVRSDSAAAVQAEGLSDGHDELAAFANATQQTQTGSSGTGDGSANGFSEPVMVLGSPNGIGLTSLKSIHVTSTEHVNVVSGGNSYIAASKSFIASVGQKISLFAQGAGMKLFAGKGKVQVMALADNLELTADKTLKIVSTSDAVSVTAQKEITLSAGGATIRIANGAIHVHAPGALDFKGASHTFAGPEGDNAANVVPASASCASQFASAAQSGAALVI